VKLDFVHEVYHAQSRTLSHFISFDKAKIIADNWPFFAEWQLFLYCYVLKQMNFFVSKI
jgi:hypothetical protein